MAKNITVLIGSPRRGGNTDVLADAFIAGAKSAGHRVTKIYAGGHKKIGCCLDCGFCTVHGGECAQKDGMEEVYQALMTTEVLVLATPIYFYGFSSQLKAVIDRLHTPLKKKFPIRETVLLSVCADSGTGTFAPLVSEYRSIGGYLGWRNAGIVTADSCSEKGDISGRPELEAAADLGRNI